MRPFLGATVATLTALGLMGCGPMGDPASPDLAVQINGSSISVWIPQCKDRQVKSIALYKLGGDGLPVSGAKPEWIGFLRADLGSKTGPFVLEASPMFTSVAGSYSVKDRLGVLGKTTIGEFAGNASGGSPDGSIHYGATTVTESAAGQLAAC